MWARLRAALITLALAAGLISGLPVPGDNVLARWPAPLRPWGARIGPIQAFLMQPFRFIGDGLLIVQRWNLFAGAKTERYWLMIEGRAAGGGEWQVLYRPHDARHTLLASELEYRRVRGAWNPRGTSPTGGYAAFVNFVAQRIFAEKPAIEEVRVRFEAIRIRPRGAGFEATGTFAFEQVRTRRDVGP